MMFDLTRCRAARKSSAVLAEPLEPRRLLAAVDGAFDLFFGDDGVAAIDPPGSSGSTATWSNTAKFWADADGSLTMFGHLQDDSYKAVLTRMNHDGQRDASFGDDGRVIITTSGNGRPDTAARLPDGSFYVVGWWSSGTGTSNRFLLYVQHLGPDGSPVAGFGDATGTVHFHMPHPPTSLDIAPDGDLLIGGADYIREQPSILRVNADGTLDTDWGDNGLLILDATPATSSPYTRTEGALGTLFLPDSSLLIVTKHEDGVGSVTKVDPQGNIDRSYGNNGAFLTPATVGVPTDIELAPDGGVFLTTHVSSTYTSAFLQRLTPDGHLAVDWGDEGLVGFSTGDAGFDAAMTPMGDDLLLSGWIEFHTHGSGEVDGIYFAKVDQATGRFVESFGDGGVAFKPTDARRGSSHGLLGPDGTFYITGQGTNYRDGYSHLSRHLINTQDNASRFLPDSRRAYVFGSALDDEVRLTVNAAGEIVAEINGQTVVVAPASAVDEVLLLTDDGNDHATLDAPGVSVIAATGFGDDVIDAHNGFSLVKSGQGNDTVRLHLAAPSQPATLTTDDSDGGNEFHAIGSEGADVFTVDGRRLTSKLWQADFQSLLARKIAFNLGDGADQPTIAVLGTPSSGYNRTTDWSVSTGAGDDVLVLDRPSGEWTTGLVHTYVSTGIGDDVVRVADAVQGIHFHVGFGDGDDLLDLIGGPGGHGQGQTWDVRADWIVSNADIGAPGYTVLNNAADPPERVDLIGDPAYSHGLDLARDRVLR